MSKQVSFVVGQTVQLLDIGDPEFDPSDEALKELAGSKGVISKVDNSREIVEFKGLSGMEFNFYEIKAVVSDMPLKPGVEYRHVESNSTLQLSEDVDDDEVVLLDSHWECDCDDNFVHNKATYPSCTVCHAVLEESPDARWEDWLAKYDPGLKSLSSMSQSFIPTAKSGESA